MCALAGALRWEPLSLLRLAGYDRDVISVLDDLRAVNRRSERSETTRGLIEYAVRLFPRRGERYRESAYANALAIRPLPAVDSVVVHRPAARPLARAYDVLGDGSLEVECRRAVAGELVRSWTYGIDATFARSTEQSAYVRTPGIGEPPGVPLLPVGLLTRLTETRKS